MIGAALLVMVVELVFIFAIALVSCSLWNILAPGAFGAKQMSIMQAAFVVFVTLIAVASLSVP